MGNDNLGLSNGNRHKSFTTTSSDDDKGRKLIFNKCSDRSKILDLEEIKGKKLPQASNLPSSNLISEKLVSKSKKELRKSVHLVKKNRAGKMNSQSASVYLKAVSEVGYRR